MNYRENINANSQKIHDKKNKDLVTFNPENDKILINEQQENDINKLMDEGNEIRIYSESVQSYKESPFVKPK